LQWKMSRYEKVLRVPKAEGEKEMFNRIATAWCQKMHTRAMWPIHGKYTCPQCLREYPVAWEGLPKPTEYADPALRNAGIPGAVDVGDLAHQV